MFDSSKVSKDQRAARKTRRATNMGRKPRISLENRGKELPYKRTGTHKEKLHIKLVAVKEVSETF